MLRTPSPTQQTHGIEQRTATRRVSYHESRPGDGADEYRFGAFDGQEEDVAGADESPQGEQDESPQASDREQSGHGTRQRVGDGRQVGGKMVRELAVRKAGVRLRGGKRCSHVSLKWTSLT